MSNKILKYANCIFKFTKREAQILSNVTPTSSAVTDITDAEDGSINLYQYVLTTVGALASSSSRTYRVSSTKVNNMSSVALSDSSLYIFGIAEYDSNGVFVQSWIYYNKAHNIADDSEQGYSTETLDIDSMPQSVNDVFRYGYKYAISICKGTGDTSDTSNKVAPAAVVDYLIVKAKQDE